MKEFQNMIGSYLLNREKQKKYLAIVLSLSMLVSFAVPLSLMQPAESMTANREHLATQLAYDPDAPTLTNCAGSDANVIADSNGTKVYSPKEMSEVTLLIGEFNNAGGVENPLDWAANCTTAEQVVEAAKKEYFLGIAYDFCVFVENDFNAYKADAEGRVAAGGDILFNDGYNYQIGSGDYAIMQALIESDNYMYIRNFAHAIAGGSMYRINTMSTGRGSLGVNFGYHTVNPPSEESYTAFYGLERDLYKRLVVGEGQFANSLHFKDGQDIPYGDSCNHDVPGNCETLEACAANGHAHLHSVNEQAQFYEGNLINFDDYFTWLRNQSAKLSRMETTGTVKYAYNNDHNQSADTLILTAPEGTTAKVIYFNLDDLVDETNSLSNTNWMNPKAISFRNIPKDANIIVNSGGTDINIEQGIVQTYIWYVGEEKATPIFNGGASNENNNDKYKDNNKKDSERILYNFYEAEKVTINSNFNGTIFAPDADVVSNENECSGHLSGALIAKSFKGGLEFGYRPYRGPAEIIGTTSGYAVPMNKFSGSGTHLIGAEFEITSNDEVVDSFVSGDETEYITFPTMVDFSGNTNYKDPNQTKTYNAVYEIREVSAPEGYILDDEKYYKVEITETVSDDFLFINTTRGDGFGTFPQTVNTDVKLFEGKNLLHTWEIETFDIYGEGGIKNRRVTVSEDDGPSEIFYLDVNAEEGLITRFSRVTDPEAETSVSEYDYEVLESKVTILTTDVPAETNVLVSEASYYTVSETVAVTMWTWDEAGTSSAVIKTEAVLDENGQPQTMEGGSTVTKVVTETSYVTETYAETENIWNHELQSNETVVRTDVVRDQYGQPQTMEGGSTVTKVVTNTRYATETTLKSSMSTIQTSVTSSYEELRYYHESRTETVGVYPDEAREDPLNKLDAASTFTVTRTVEDSTNTESYYYDPVSMMVMPLPDVTPSFVNRFGLTFMKVDDKGKELTGAIIQLKKPDGTLVDESIWSWSQNQSSQVIDVSKLTELGSDFIFSFHEEGVPAGFEQADDIFFKVEGNLIHYGAAADQLDHTLDLTKERTLKMTDEKVYGVQLTLNKVDFVTQNILPGATLVLNAENDTEIHRWENFDGTEDIFSDPAFIAKGTAEDGLSEYVQNGYLKPGVYYLTEPQVPTHANAANGDVYANPGRMYFTVNEDYTVSSGKPAESMNLIVKPESDARMAKIFKTDETLDIENVKSVKIKVESWRNNPDLKLYLNDDILIAGSNNFTKDVISGDNAYYSYEHTFDPPTTLNKFEIQNWSDDKVVVRYAEIVSENGTYTFEESSAGPIITYTFRLNDGTIKTGTIDGTLDSSGVMMKQEIGDSANVTSIVFNLAEGYTANRFEVIANDWGGDNKETVLKELGQQVSEIELPLSKPSTSIKQLHISGIIAPANTTPIEYDTINPLLSVNGNSLTVSNKVQGEEIDVSVRKDWIDEGFESYRADGITVHLYQSKTELQNIADLTAEQLEEIAYKVDGVHQSQVLNAGNHWKHTWTQLPSKWTDGTTGQKSPYYYYVIETGSPDSYDVEYTKGTDGTLVVKNTLQTIDLLAAKIWEKPEGVTGVYEPEFIQVQLQWKNGNEWEDVTGKTLKLLKTNGFIGRFDDLPAGKEYRICEIGTPYGWTFKEDSYVTADEDGEQMKITNKINTAALQVKKIWNGDSEGRPQMITVKLYRSTVPPPTADLEDNIATVQPTQPASVTEDYSRLLQYSLYFYDANMCGVDAGVNSAFNWRDACHTGEEVDGGFHDAGDHAIFGLPQGFAASTLGWTYYEYSDSFEELGLKQHYKIIMDEFCDFFVDSTTLSNDNVVTEFVYQKGNGDTDHGYWGKPEEQEEIAGTRKIYKTNNSASDIAANYAAALAQHVLNFPEDHPNAASGEDEYLKCAKALYAFSTTYNKCAEEGASGFYWEGEDKCADEQAWAAAWLYLATGEDYYKQQCQSKQWVGIDYSRGHYWGNAALAASIVNAAYLGGSWDTSINFHGTWDANAKKINGKCGNTGYQVFNDWGSARHNALVQTTALITAKHIDGTNDNNTALAKGYREWAKQQMAYILGANSVASNGNGSTCFVAGFAENSAKYPHHRAASGYTKPEIDALNGSKPTVYDTDGHVLVGALIGGPNGSGGYLDNVDGPSGGTGELVWQTNEVAIDYNAGLVGAAAALYDAYGTGTLVTNPTDIDEGIEKAYPSAIVPQSTPTAQDLSSTPLAQSANRKASSIKGVTVVGSERVAKGTLVRTITDATAGTTYPLTSPIEDVTYVEIEINADDQRYNGHMEVNGYAKQGNFEANTNNVVTISFDSSITVSTFTVYFGWNEANPSLKEVRFYTDSATPSLTITNAPESLIAGCTAQLGVENNSGTVTSWQSSDSAVAAVDGNGKVTAGNVTQETDVTITAKVSEEEMASVTIKIVPFRITKDPGTVAEYNFIVLHANKPADWTASGENVKLEPSGDGMSCTVTGVSVTNSPVTVTATAKDGIGSDTAAITVTPAELTINPDSITLRTGESKELTITPPTGWTLNSGYDTAMIEIVPDDVNGKLTLKALKAGGPVTFSVSREGQEKSGTVTIYEPLRLTGASEMALTDEQTLTLENAIDPQNVSWTSSNPTAITVDSNGVLRAVGNGSATIKATDIDGAYAEMDVSVAVSAIKPALPESKELVGRIYIKENAGTGEWTINTTDGFDLSKLPITDGQGHRYYYYIEEVDQNGSPVDAIRTDKAVFIPTAYDNNGVVLQMGQGNEISVTNDKTESIQGQMPSAGGEGTTWYYIAGAAMMLAGIAGYFVLMRRQRSRAKA